MCVSAGSVPPIMTGFPSFSTSRRHRMDLSRADRPKKRRDVRIASELAEREDDTRICCLVVLDDEFEWATENATGFVDLVDREFRALGLKAARLSAGPSERGNHPDLYRACSKCRMSSAQRTQCEREQEDAMRY